MSLLIGHGENEDWSALAAKESYELNNSNKISSRTGHYATVGGMSIIDPLLVILSQYVVFTHLCRPMTSLSPCFKYAFLHFLLILPHSTSCTKLILILRILQKLLELLESMTARY